MIDPVQHTTMAGEMRDDNNLQVITQNCYLLGMADITVVEGDACVLGYELRPHRTVSVFSDGQYAMPIEVASNARLHCTNIGLAPSVQGLSYQLSSFSDEIPCHLTSIPSNWYDLANAIGSGSRCQMSTLIHGPISSGKSTLSRFLTNRHLNRYDTVAYLDCDPGQPEFTAPGHISITLVTTPLLGPSYTHSRQPEFSIHIGDITPLSNISHYLNGIRELASRANKLDCPLIINTMGWNDGSGLEILSEIIEVCKPFNVIQVEDALSAPEAAGVKRPFELLPSYRPILVHKISSQSRKNVAQQSGKERRSLSFAASLLGNAACRYNIVDLSKHVMGMPCYRIRFADIRVRFIQAEDPSSYSSESLLPSLNASFIGICIENGECDPFPGCIGLGIVRAIDAASRCFYIMTSVCPLMLQNATCFIRGSLEFPSTLMFQDHDANAFRPPYLRCLPFSNSVGASEMKSRKNVQRNRNS
uniref:Uncharacterized protein n=1 Tax=Spongospora subterranea TaxID=70186 RepID=A0A0H5R8X4_9EUKA|eukprot:CRZ04824.1 hypothetical protein [Spongospora subterranea]